jgi:hypothetical protein
VSAVNATSNIITMNVSAPTPPSVTITASNTTICPNGQAVFTATSVNAGSSPSYQWKKNGVNVGSNINTYTIYPSTVVSDGSTIQVIMTSSSACASPNTASSNIITMTLSQPIIANAGRDTITCAGTGVLIGIPPVAGYTYSWSPNIWLSSPSSSQTIANPPGTTNYHLKVSTAGDACSAMDTVVVKVIPLPSPPSISQSGSQLTASSSPGYQWYNNNVLIPNATNPTYTPTSSGTYSVRAVFNGCLSAVSNSISVVITAVNDPVLDRQVQITPNPVHDKLYISSPASNRVFDLTLLDISGVKIFTKTEFRNTLEVDMKMYSAGTYVVRLVDKHSGEHIQRIIVKF